MRRLLQQKRDDVLRQSAVVQEDQQHRQEDRKRAKEEKARQARLDAIQVSNAVHSAVSSDFFPLFYTAVGAGMYIGQG